MGSPIAALLPWQLTLAKLSTPSTTRFFSTQFAQRISIPTLCTGELLTFEVVWHVLPGRVLLPRGEMSKLVFRRDLDLTLLRAVLTCDLREVAPVCQLICIVVDFRISFDKHINWQNEAANLACSTYKSF